MTNDLEKIADTIVFLHNGKVLFSKPKDELRYQYGIMKCGTQQFKRSIKMTELHTGNRTMSGRSWWPIDMPRKENIQMP